MDIDGRIDKLAERHEGLAQTVELLVAENRDRVREDRERIQEQREREARLGKLVVDLVESLQRLAAIAENHERRITHFQGGATA